MGRSFTASPERISRSTRLFIRRVIRDRPRSAPLHCHRTGGGRNGVFGSLDIRHSVSRYLFITLLSSLCLRIYAANLYIFYDTPFNTFSRQRTIFALKTRKNRVFEVPARPPAGVFIAGHPPAAGSAGGFDTPTPAGRSRRLGRPL